MIRFILVLLFLLLYLILGIPVLLVEFIIGKFNLELKSKSSLAMVQWGFRCILFLAGAKITVIGEENVPTDKAVLYICNHRSYFDILMTYSRVPRLTGYIAKKEMLRIPLLSTWMKYLNCLFLDRQDVKQGLKTILEAIDKVKSGISICIFPEGTRNRTTETFMEFHEGSFKIAEKSGCPIVPVAINNAGAIFEDHIPFIKKAHVVIEYGEPFSVNDLDKEQKKHIGAYTKDIISRMYFKNEKLV